MGKNLKQQRRGKGGSYKSPSHRYVGKISYPSFKSGKVTDIMHAPGRRTPVASIATEGKKFMQIASKGMQVGQVIDTEKPGQGQQTSSSKTEDKRDLEEAKKTGDFAKVLLGRSRKFN